jgi:thiol-disulfide isomerase/thioredoxin
MWANNVSMKIARPAPPTAVLLAALLSLAACSGSAAPTTTAPTTTAPTTTAPPTTAPNAPTQASSPGVAVLNQAWATAPLVDVTTGETFRLADLAGKVVIVETMAIWCTNCRIQQATVERALTELPTERVVYVVLDVDPNEDAESLAAYRTQRGYTGRYAIAPADVARALAADFGDQFLNPPSTPIVVIGADGSVTRTDFGQKSSEEIVALARAGGA